ncbi:phospholipase D family protein [Nocardia sp. NPDC019219]|uniref:phospholipase D-like domain-containing protein n=1 Tax=Nocardia sp. NPDC019219 TaxID=3154590 RepID=UPI0033EE008B
MAGVLESLRPLHALIAQADDPVALATVLSRMVCAGAEGSAISAAIAAEIADARLVHSTLSYAGIVTDDGELADTAAARLAQLQVIEEMSASDSWELVATVPEFLRGTHSSFVDRFGPAARLRQTKLAIPEIAVRARHRLIIAAPYLHGEVTHALATQVRRILRARGEVIVITRAISSLSLGQSRPNAEAVARLRAASPAGGTLRIRSWEGPGLGIHFKALVADDEWAYLGSANLTPGGMADHAEIGVLLRGRRVRQLARWMEAVAEELNRTSPTQGADPLVGRPDN